MIDARTHHPLHDPTSSMYLVHELGESWHLGRRILFGGDAC
jgi:hypothetical protein